MTDDGLSRRQLLALAGGGAIALGAGAQAHDSGLAPAITPAADIELSLIGFEEIGADHPPDIELQLIELNEVS